VNDTQKMQMALDRSGLVELCDSCGEWIFDERFRRLAFITEDGKIVCPDCRILLTLDSCSAKLCV
jgi:formylmethanofuran dehydrogenase subunit E